VCRARDLVNSSRSFSSNSAPSLRWSWRKWHVRRTSGAPKALAVALSFCRLLGLGCPKQAFAKMCRNAFCFVYTYASATIPTKQRPYAFWGLPALAFALHGWQREHRVKFLPLAWAGMPKTSFRKNSDSPRQKVKMPRLSANTWATAIFPRNGHR
jgi:hypothetical protein